jgi:hypothetical protein
MSREIASSRVLGQDGRARLAADIRPAHTGCDPSTTESVALEIPRARLRRDGMMGTRFDAIGNQTSEAMNRPATRTPVLALLGMLVVSSAVLYWYQYYGPGYDAELRVIRGALERLPDVEILELGGYDDHDVLLLPALEHVAARVEIAGKGELVFAELTEDSVGDAQHLWLVSVGPYRIRVRGEGHMGVYMLDTGESVRSEFSNGMIDLGPQGEFAHLFPFDVRNIQTAVERYDELLEVVSGWPQTPAAPRHLRDARGTDFYYWVATEGGERDDPNWTAPLAELQAAALVHEAN